MKLLVIGLGSVNGDDQIGWEIIDALEKEASNNLPITVYKSKGAGIDWFSSLDQTDYQCVVFVDAIMSDGKLGNIREIDLNRLDSSQFLTQYSSHNISIIDSINLAKNLGMLGMPVKFIGVEIGSASPLTDMSELIKVSVPVLIERICSLTQSAAVLE